MDSNHDLFGLLATAHQAAENKDWEQVYRLTKERAETITDEKLRREFVLLFERADMERQVAKALDLLQKAEVREANQILSRLIIQQPEATAGLEKRLKPELEIIRRAIQKTPSFQALFEQAQAWASLSMPQRLKALHLYRYIGGEAVERLAGWPPYCLTLRTAEARREAARLRGDLRSPLGPLLEAYRLRETVPLARDVSDWADLAGSLAEAGLLETEEERAAVRWVETIADQPSAAQNLNLENGDSMSDHYRDVLDQLNKELERLEKLHHPDAEELWADLDRFTQWVDGGKKGPAPDLARWGVKSQPQDPDQPAVEQPQPTASINIGSMTWVVPTSSEEPPDDASKVDSHTQAGGLEPAQEETDEEPPSRPDRVEAVEIPATQADGLPVIMIENEIAEEPELPEETLEEQRFDRGLNEARDLLGSGEITKLREALVRLEYMVKQRSIDQDRLERTRELLEQARRERTRLMNEAIEEGNMAKTRGDLEAARKAFERAQQFDEDGIVNASLLELDQQYGEQLSKEKLRELRSNLRAFDDIGRLEVAVREAERLQDEGRLPEDLLTIARKGRERFDELRKLHGEVTTQARFGTLSESKLAVDQLKRIMGEGQKSILDPIIGTRSPSEALEEANYYWRERSFEAVQYTLTQIKKFLPARPRIALSLYERALEEEVPDPQDESKRILVARPFHEDARRMLEESRTAIDAELKRLEGAENLLELARTETDAVEVFRLLLQARNDFPYLDGLDAQLDRARQTALKTMLARIETSHITVNGVISQFRFEDARQAVMEARELVASWPEETPPQALADKEAESIQLLKDITHQETNYREFQNTAAQIREYRQDERQLPLAFNLLKSLNDDPRFTMYPYLRELNIEMDDFRGVGEQLETARQAADEGDWERVYNLTKDKAQTVSEEKIRQEFMQLFTRADLERKVNHALELLKNAEVREANQLLSRLVSSGDAAEELKERLKNELEIIRQAIQDTPQVQDLANLADQKASQTPYAERLLALRLYRHVGGIGLKAEPDWPQYRLSLRTAEARRKAVELARELRAELLTPVLMAYQKREVAPPAPVQARHWAEQARGLREAELLESDEERAAVRWLELEQGFADAGQLEAAGEWEKAVAFWKDLDLHYPRTADIQERLRKARVQEAVKKAEGLLKQDKSLDALKILWEAQADMALSQEPAINLCLADVHAARDEFVEVFNALARLEKDPKTAPLAAEKRAELERERTIRRALERAETEWEARLSPKGEFEARRVRQALEILQEPDPFLVSSKRVADQISEYFNASKHRLLETVEAALQALTPTGKLVAMKALIDLRTLEAVRGIPEEESVSLPRIREFAGELPIISRSLLKDLGQMELNGKRAVDALAETQEIGDRLDTFSRVLEYFPAGLEDEIKAVRVALIMVGSRLEKLESVVALSAKINNEKIWEKALAEHNFSELTALKNQLDALELPGLLELDYLEKKLVEWQAIHDYLQNEMVRLQELYVAYEDFEQVQKILARLKARPSRLNGVEGFTVVQQAEYESIYNFMGARLKIIPLFDDNNLNGWEEVLAAADKRQDEFLIWKQWLDELKQCKVLVDNSYELAKAHLALAGGGALSQPEARLGTQKRDWENLAAKVQAAVEVAECLPKVGEDLLPVLSEKAEKCQAEGEGLRNILRRQAIFASEKIDEVERHIQALGGFPTGEELAYAVEMQNWDRLRLRLEHAEKIGPSNTDEEKRIRIYREVMMKTEQDDEPNGVLGFVKKILGR